MSTNAAQSLISSAQIYKPEIYQAAEKGSSCEDEKIGTASTNVVAQILMEKVILLLPGTPALAQQVEKKKIDEDTAKKMEGIFRTIGFTPNKVKGPRLEEDRHDLALRTANLFKSEYQLQLRALILYLTSRNFSRDDALQNILGTWSGGSLSDAVGNKALDVFKADFEIQKKRSAAARAESAAARAESAKAKAESAKARLEAEALDCLCDIADMMKLGYKTEASHAKFLEKIDRIKQGR